ncbi:helix-turn-helix transcriptional regulator [Streptomyces sp. NPDC052225]|uniref:helix-turn-helix transcriptional regulator n=1 Tax=Streptomyces sp. NPDC052225 TaxID=3154949 RepID=UPI0034205893
MEQKVERAEVRAAAGDAAAEALRGVYGPGLRMGGTREGAGSFHVRHAAAAGMSYDEVRLPARLNFTNDALGPLVVITTLRGAVERTCGRHQGTFTAGDVWLANAPERPYAARTDQFDAATVNLSPQLLAEAAAAVAPGTTDRLRFTELVAADPQNAALWESARAYTRAVCASPALENPLVMGTLARHLAALALQVFPNNLTDRAPLPADTRDATPLTVTRARAFVDEHAHTDIGLTDIAAAVRVTPRALQYAFRKHLDVTPLEYLRRVRLAGAHQDLQAALPGTGITVTAVAMRWGFSHLGRFATQYRTAYGRPPSTTLRQTP